MIKSFKLCISEFNKVIFLIFNILYELLDNYVKRTQIKKIRFQVTHTHNEDDIFIGMLQILIMVTMTVLGL